MRALFVITGFINSCFITRVAVAQGGGTRVGKTERWLAGFAPGASHVPVLFLPGRGLRLVIGQFGNEES